MGKPIPLSLDYDGSGLRRVARDSEDAVQVRRLVSIRRAPRHGDFRLRGR
jgi:hypothetical protein